MVCLQELPQGGTNSNMSSTISASTQSYMIILCPRLQIFKNSDILILEEYISVCRTGKRGILGHFMILRKNDLKLDS